MSSAATIVPAMSIAESLFGLLRPALPPKVVCTSDGQIENHANAVRPQFRLPALGDAPYRPLAPGIRRPPRRALHARRRRDGDDVAGLAFLHLRHDAVGDVDEPEDVGVEKRLHPPHIEGADLGAVIVRGVVDEHVDAAHVLHAGVDRARVVFGDGDVGSHTHGAGLSGHRLDRRSIATGEHDLMAGL